MTEIVISVPGYRCERCGHEWIGRARRNNPDPQAKPRQCPTCKSPWWDVPRVTANRDEQADC